MSATTPQQRPAHDGPDAPRAFESVLEHVEEQITSGSLRVGDRLPPERDLALQLGVSRPAVREAIRTLQAQGVLASRVGSGSQAGTHVISERGSALGRLLRLQVALAQFPIDDVVNTRVTLERSSAELAAERIDVEGVGRLEELLAAMGSSLDPEDFNHVDTAFHVTIAELAGNTLLGDLTQAVRESLRRPILSAERRLERWEDTRRELLADHRAIADAIAAGEGDRAATLMEEHIRSAYALLRIEVEPEE